MQSAKESARQILDRLPDQASWEDIMYEPYYAELFVDRLIETTDKLEDHPRIGRRVPEADQRDDIRELIVQGYRIIYLVALPPSGSAPCCRTHSSRRLPLDEFPAPEVAHKERRWRLVCLSKGRRW